MPSVNGRRFIMMHRRCLAVVLFASFTVLTGCDTATTGPVGDEETPPDEELKPDSDDSAWQ